jgi:integration host factor subunit alpha
MTLTKAELGEHLVIELNTNKLVAKDIVEQLFEEIRRALEHGENVKISGFGNFDLRDKFSRPGRNPKTGEDRLVSARRVVTFKAGHKLKSKVENFNNSQPGLALLETSPEE